MFIKLLHKILEIPLVFHLQQKICNNYENIFSEFSDYLKCNNKKIIEIGCSTGFCASKIIDMKNNHYTGVDIQPEYINKAKLLFPNGNFICQDARSLKFNDSSFDIALFNGVVHHMDDDLFKNCLNEVKRIIKNDGLILISEPVFNYKDLLSTIFLKLDRGKYIRKFEQYSKLITDLNLNIKRTRFFRFSLHKFVSFVVNKKI
jgi:ubiquinone/menaquinone biosynthesis C-methylase UbiE